MEMSLNNYDGLTNPRKHVKNMHNSLELVIKDCDSMCKILSTTFRGFMCAWHNNLEPNSIKGFSDIYSKLVACFMTSIPVKKNFTELFSIAQQERETTRAYLKWLNEEMFKVEEFIEPVALEALIRVVKKHASWRKLYALPDTRLSKVMQFMENHIWVKEVSLLRHGPPYFYKDNQWEWLSRWSDQGNWSKYFSSPLWHVSS